MAVKVLGPCRIRFHVRENIPLYRVIFLDISMIQKAFLNGWNDIQDYSRSLASVPSRGFPS